MSLTCHASCSHSIAPLQQHMCTYTYTHAHTYARIHTHTYTHHNNKPPAPTLPTHPRVDSPTLVSLGLAALQRSSPAQLKHQCSLTSLVNLLRILANPPSPVWPPPFQEHHSHPTQDPRACPQYLRPSPPHTPHDISTSNFSSNRQASSSSTLSSVQPSSTNKRPSAPTHTSSKASAHSPAPPADVGGRISPFQPAKQPSSYPSMDLNLQNIALGLHPNEPGAETGSDLEGLVQVRSQLYDVCMLRRKVTCGALPYLPVSPPCLMFLLYLPALPACFTLLLYFPAIPACFTFLHYLPALPACLSPCHTILLYFPALPSCFTSLFHLPALPSCVTSLPYLPAYLPAIPSCFACLLYLPASPPCLTFLCSVSCVV
jgi:hypothetical protein